MEFTRELLFISGRRTFITKTRRTITSLIRPIAKSEKTSVIREKQLCRENLEKSKKVKI